MSNDILEPNFNTRNSGQAYQALSKSLASSPDAEKLATDEIIGTLDDSVDIADPSYNEAETHDIEVELAQKDGIAPPEATETPEDPLLKTEAESFAIEEPNVPDPY